MRAALALLLAACAPQPAGPFATSGDTGPRATEPGMSTAPAPTTATTPTTSSPPCADGTPACPFPLGPLPATATGDTTLSVVRAIDTYSCAASDEGGAEVWFLADVPEPGLLVATVDEVAGDGIDVDVHLLTGTDADSCLARDDASAAAFVDAGPTYVVVDTWRDGGGIEYPGPFTLTVEHVPDGTPTSTGACGADMVAIEGFCIDRYEGHLAGLDPYQVPTTGLAANAAGAVPQGYISGEVAEAACQAAGKRLCTSDEWIRACEGPAGNVYPYGDTYQAGACNEGRSSHPVIELFGPDATFSPTEMNDPRLNQLPDSLAPSGAHPACVSAEGVYDLHGNLHEWVADSSGTFRGGFYVDASINGAGCSYRTTAHSFDYHDYSTGFRCCADPF